MGAETAGLVLDAVLAATVVTLGWRCVFTADRFESVALFIGIGFVMSIAWTRLAAPDLALAEAALGAGLTGAMLLAAWAEVGHRDAQASSGPLGAVTIPAVLSAAVMGVAAVAVAPLLDDAAGLSAAVDARIAETGVSHPVTAVLVDFRAFDTLLELCVLLAALVATWQLGAARPLLRGRLRGPVFMAYVRIVLPLLVVLAGALLWRGAQAPGGAFQAGAVLAAAGILLLLADPVGRAPPLIAVYRVGSVLGVLAFLGLGVSMVFVTGGFLDWPQAAAGALVLVAEGAATISIGLTLALMVVGGRPVAARRRRSRGAEIRS